MKIKELNGLVIWESDGHGKAVKGTKKTSSIQVRQYMSNGYMLLKQKTFPVDDTAKRDKAIYKCEMFILGIRPHPHTEAQ